MGDLTRHTTPHLPHKLTSDHRNLVMSRQSPLWPSSDPSSCDWDEYGRRKSTFEPSNPAMPEMATDITSLLSAQSYLLPEPSWAQNSQSSTPSPGDSGFVLELESANYRNPPNQPDPSKLKTPRVQRRQQRGRQKVASVKGQEGDDHHENPTEVRRALVDLVCTVSVLTSLRVTASSHTNSHGPTCISFTTTSFDRRS